MIQGSYVYGLQDPRDRQLRYVGKANNVDRRLRQHISRARSGINTPVKEWIRELLSDGYKPEVFIIEKVSAEDVFEAEDFWWQYFRYIGASLLNCFQPSKGVLYHHEEVVRRVAEAHRGRKRSEQTRRRISEAAKKRFAIPQNHPMYGKPRPSEVRAKISKTRRVRRVAAGGNNPMFGRTHSDATRQRLSEINKNKHLSERHREAIGRGLQRYYESNESPLRGTSLQEDHRRAISATLRQAYKEGRITPSSGMLGKHHSEATKQRIRERNLGKKMSLASRQKMRKRRAEMLPCKYECGFTGTQAERANHIRWKHCPNLPQEAME